VHDWFAFERIVGTTESTEDTERGNRVGLGV
jgi:hypothetical protein